MDLGTFFIERIVVHDVPRNNAETSPVDIVFSDIDSPLNTGLRNFFKERTTRSLARHGYKVEHDSDQPSPVPGLIGAALTDADQLVSASRDFASHLYATQPPVSNPGLLVCLFGRLEDGACLGILKLEREDAIRVEEKQLPGGQTTFDVAHLRDLMLGRHTRLFKASVFALTDRGELRGLVSDDQRGYHPTTEVATFFLSKFLGCRLRTAPDVSTKSFFEATQRWIAREVADPEHKARYEIGLLQEMNRQESFLTPNRFAEENLEVKDRQSYRKFLAAEGAPTTRFDKDIGLVASRVRRLSMGFIESRLKLSGPPDDIDRFVRVNPDGSDAAPVEIHDRLDEVRGGG